MNNTHNIPSEVVSAGFDRIINELHRSPITSTIFGLQELYYQLDARANGFANRETIQASIQGYCAMGKVRDVDVWIAADLNTGTTTVCFHRVYFEDADETIAITFRIDSLGSVSYQP